MIGYTEISLSLSLFLSKKKWSGHIDSDAQTDSRALGWRLRRSVHRSAFIPDVSVYI